MVQCTSQPTRQAVGDSSSKYHENKMVHLRQLDRSASVVPRLSTDLTVMLGNEVQGGNRHPENAGKSLKAFLFFSNTLNTLNRSYRLKDSSFSYVLFVVKAK